MSKAGAPIVKKKRPFVTGDVMVVVTSDDCNRITGFSATFGGKTHEIKVKDNILTAWQKLEALIDKHVAKELLRKKP